METQGRHKPRGREHKEHVPKTATPMEMGIMEIPHPHHPDKVQKDYQNRCQFTKQEKPREHKKW